MLRLKTLARLGLLSLPLLLLAACADASPPPAPFTPAPLPTLSLDADADARHDRLAQVGAWLYQLQGPDGAPLNLSALDARGADLLVIDYSRDGSDPGAFSPAEIAAAQADGTIVLAYLSIGEAEEGRFYFDPAWLRDGHPTDAAPPWLAGANPDWLDNYNVQFWEPDWQAIILGPGGYLHRILAAGFDGVYLDKIDAWESWWDFGSGLPPLEAQDMVHFVEAIAQRARVDLARPDFLVLVQNAPDILEALHEDQQIDYLTAVDALAAEDTFYFGNADEDNPLDVQEYALAHLRRLRDAGKPIFAVDYLRDPATQAEFYARARAEGFIPLVASRALDRVLVQPE